MTNPDKRVMEEARYPSDEEMEQIHDTARRSYQHHRQQVRGQQMTIGDNPDTHLIWAAIDWTRAQSGADTKAVMDEFERRLNNWSEAVLSRSTAVDPTQWSIANGAVLTADAILKAFVQRLASRASPSQPVERIADAILNASSMGEATRILLMRKEHGFPERDLGGLNRTALINVIMKAQEASNA